METKTIVKKSREETRRRQEAREIHEKIVETCAKVGENGWSNEAVDQLRNVRERMDATGVNLSGRIINNEGGVER